MVISTIIYSVIAKSLELPLCTLMSNIMLTDKFFEEKYTRVCWWDIDIFIAALQEKMALTLIFTSYNDVIILHSQVCIWRNGFTCLPKTCKSL